MVSERVVGGQLPRGASESILQWAASAGSSLTSLTVCPLGTDQDVDGGKRLDCDEHCIAMAMFICEELCAYGGLMALSGDLIKGSIFRSSIKEFQFFFSIII